MLNDCKCGGKAELFFVDYCRHDKYIVYCNDCDIQTTEYENDDEAIEAWNRGDVNEV